jgi:hypothetical protein
MTKRGQLALVSIGRGGKRSREYGHRLMSQTISCIVYQSLKGVPVWVGDARKTLVQYGAGSDTFEPRVLNLLEKLTATAILVEKDAHNSSCLLMVDLND